MKKFTFILFFFCRTLLANTLVLGTGEYIPYTGEKIEGFGVTTMIVKAAFKEVNIDVKIEFMPWNRVMNNVKNKTLAGSFPWTMNEERKKDLLYSDLLQQYRLQLFVRKDQTANAQNFKGKTFCLPSGWDSTRYRELENKYKTKLVRPINVESCIHMLARGRVDFMSMNGEVANSALEKIYGKNSPIVSVNSFEFTKVNDLYFIVAKNYPNAKEIIRQFNLGLGIIKKNGVYLDIMNHNQVQKDSFISTCGTCNQLGSL
jgi:polar amino acid transport system substrate-binding protein